MKQDDRYFLTIKNVPMKEHKTGRLIAHTLFPYIEPFDDSLEALQNQVGGFIEHCSILPKLNEKGIDMWCNEEGKLQGLHPTFTLFDEEKKEIVDFVVGSCVFTRYNEEGETLGLTQSDIDEIMCQLGMLPFVPVSDRDGALEYTFVVDGYRALE